MLMSPIVRPLANAAKMMQTIARPKLTKSLTLWLDKDVGGLW